MIDERVQVFFGPWCLCVNKQFDEVQKRLQLRTKFLLCVEPRDCNLFFFAKGGVFFFFLVVVVACLSFVIPSGVSGYVFICIYYISLHKWSVASLLWRRGRGGFLRVHIIIIIFFLF
jgi:hypothetical protein